jgi:hypothetical protein
MGVNDISKTGAPTLPTDTATSSTSSTPASVPADLPSSSPSKDVLEEPGSLPSVEALPAPSAQDLPAPQKNPDPESARASSLPTIPSNIGKEVGAVTSNASVPNLHRTTLINRYKLEKAVKQKQNTRQCWWLSSLENLRDQNKLIEVFETGVLKGSVVPRTRGRSVYGPKWQRTIMNFLKDKNWHKSTDTFPVARRPEELMRLFSLLGIEGVTLSASMTITPWNIDKHFGSLELGQSVQLDKPEHAMSGIVKTSEYTTPKGNIKTRKVIKVYNQTNKRFFEVWPQGEEAGRRLQDESGEIVINHLIAVHIEDDKKS